MTTIKKDSDVVSLKCRNPKCDSISAVEVPIPRPGKRVYRCVKCNHTWSVQVGGKVDI